MIGLIWVWGYKTSIIYLVEGNGWPPEQCGFDVNVFQLVYGLGLGTV